MRFLHCWVRLIVSFPMTPTLTESLVFWCVLPLLSPPLHHSYLSFPVDGSVFNSPESTPKSPRILSVLLCKAMASLLFHHNWPLGSLLEGLGREYLRIEGMYSSRRCTHRFLSLKPPYTTPETTNFVRLFPCQMTLFVLVKSLTGYLQKETVTLVPFDSSSSSQWPQP